ncbi:hypothetical protein HK096_006883, partial [Nowakowskiella sp. JEL0078]
MLLIFTTGGRRKSKAEGLYSIDFLAMSIRFLRKNGCKLPIEVFSFSDEITFLEKRRILSFSSIEAPVEIRTVDDKRNILPLDKVADGNRWHVKIGAILNSRFEHIIALDSDTMSVVNPEFLFESVEYKATGAIFWPDFWKTHARNPVWNWLNMTCIDEFEQESSVMVIDKRKSWKPLLLVWFWNQSAESRKFVNSFLHGDKDHFRFAWHVTKTPFFMVQNMMAIGGMEMEDASFCGLSILQRHPSMKDIILFAHINLMKYRHFSFSEFNDNNPLLSKMKMYVDDLPLTWVHPPGGEPGTLKSFARWQSISTKLGFIGNTFCVDFREVGSRKVKVVSFPDKEFVQGLTKQYHSRAQWGIHWS